MNKFHFKLLQILILKTLFLNNISLWAWDDFGHSFIAKQAFSLLDSATKNKINEVLAAAPHNFKTIGQLAFYPDKVKAKGMPFEFSKQYHFANSKKSPNQSYAQIFMTDPNNIATYGLAPIALTKYAEKVMDPTITAAQKVTALAFILHIVGDLHQPLHFGYADDRGGNTIDGMLFENLATRSDVDKYDENGILRNLNLHVIWDFNLLDYDVNQKNGNKKNSSSSEVLSSNYWSQIKNKCTDIEGKNLNTLDWANESFAKFNNIYGWQAISVADTGDLAYKYFEINKLFLENRLCSGAYRLSKILTMLFSNASSNSSQNIRNILLPKVKIPGTVDTSFQYWPK